MERRWCERRRIPLEVTVQTAEAGDFLKCRARDIGFGGMFLMTGPVSFQKYQQLTVVLEMPGKPGATHAIPGRVIRSSNDGLGLRFHELGMTDVRVLQDILYHQG